MTAENRKKIEKLLIIGVFAIFVVASVSYAFFQAQTGIAGTTNVNVGTSTTDNLSFAVDGAINLNIHQFNFAEGAGNLVSNTQATATLLANNATNTATYSYYVYFNIDSNDFIYTTVDSKPEIILTVTKPDGTEVTSIAGLNYVQNVQTITNDGSTQTVNGFDITTATGLFAVASQYSITANSTSATTQEWNFTVSFINLDTDQQGNTGKSMDAEVIIQEDLIPTMVADICESGDNLASCIVEFNTLAGDGADDIYYHDADLVNGAQDNSYRYNGANPNNYVCFGATGADCQNSDNQYRIIGVFNNQVKLIKATSYGDYVWESDWSIQGNTWNETTKPDIYATLNTTYYNTISAEWQSLIAESAWQVGGMAWSDPNTVKQFYDLEVGTGQSGYEETMKIGLMYVSDYGYGANPEKWTSALTTNNYGTDNWLYLGSDEWLISRYATLTNRVFYVGSDGGGYVVDADVNYTAAVRPSFYLAFTVEISSGTGTSTDPYILNLS